MERHRVVGAMVCPLCNRAAEEDPPRTYPLIARRFEEVGFSVFLVHKECLERVAHPDVATEEWDD